MRGSLGRSSIDPLIHLSGGPGDLKNSMDRFRGS